MNLDLPPGIDSDWSNSYSGLRSFSVFLISLFTVLTEKNSKYVYFLLNKQPSLANPYVLVLYPPIHKRVVVVTGSRCELSKSCQQRFAQLNTNTLFTSVLLHRQNTMTYAIHTGTSEKRAERVIRCFDLSFYGWFLTSIETFSRFALTSSRWKLRSISEESDPEPILPVRISSLFWKAARGPMIDSLTRARIYI